MILTLEKLKTIIIAHLIENADKYVEWHKGSADELVYDATQFFTDRDFDTDIVDVLILATADALNVQLFIYKRSIKGKIEILMHGSKTATCRIYLKFSTAATKKHPNYTGANHYDAVVRVCRSTLPPPPPYQSIHLHRGKSQQSSSVKRKRINSGPAPANIPQDEVVDLTMHGNTASLATCPAEVINLSQPDLEEAEESEGFEEEADNPSISDAENPEHNGNMKSMQISESDMDRYLRQGTLYPTQLFRNQEPEVVDRLPGDIDGISYYKVNCTMRNYSKLTSDRRWFTLCTSSLRGWDGIRKVGSCQGSWECINPSCSFISIHNKVNTFHFEQKGGGMRTCYSCGHYAKANECAARKCVMIQRGSQYALVYHIGQHHCKLQHHEEGSVSYTKRCIENHPGLPFQQLRSTVIQGFIDKKMYKEAQEAADKITSRSFATAKRGTHVALHMEEVKTQSLEAVAEVKEGSDDIDTFHIYKINTTSMNHNEPDYVMKSSRKILQIALLMDQDGEQNILQEADAYFDGAHSRCREFISLALWVYHPSMRRIIRLASMEVRTESSQYVALFFTLLNEMLQTLTKKKDYKFNPKFIMCDESGAIFKGLDEVFGEEFSTTRVISCQWHFLQHAEEKMALVAEEYKEEFMQGCYDLCRIKGVAAYQIQLARLREIADMFVGVSGFLDWWDARKWHVFAAFRDGLHSGINLAEAGNSKWKPPVTKLSLVKAAKNDIATMLQQESDMRKFEDGEDCPRGRGMTDIQRATKEKRQQIEQGREFGQMLSNSAALAMQTAAERDPDYFIPNKSAKHKQSKKKKGIEGKKKRADAPIPTLQSLMRKLQDAQHVMESPETLESENENSSQEQQQSQQPVLGSGPEPRKVRPIPSVPGSPNPPYVTQTVFNVSKCQGCDVPIDSKNMAAPNNLLFRLKAIRPYRDQRTHIWHDKIGNAYFHLSLSCLTNHNKDIKVEDVTMTTEMFLSISQDHLRILAQNQLLQHIVANKEQDLQVRT